MITVYMRYSYLMVLGCTLEEGALDPQTGSATVALPTEPSLRVVDWENPEPGIPLQATLTTPQTPVVLATS